jgi:hypothetical protein
MAGTVTAVVELAKKPAAYPTFSAGFLVALFHSSFVIIERLVMNMALGNAPTAALALANE